MAISLVGTASNQNAVGGTITITLPALQNGDVVYVFQCSNPSTAGMNTAGYTQIATINPGNSPRAAAYRKKMGASPDTTAVINLVASGSGNAGIAICLRGVDQTTQEDATPTTANGGAANPDPPSITTVTPGAWVIACGGIQTVDAIATEPAGYTTAVTQASDGTANDASVTISTKVVAAAGAEDPAAYTSFSASLRWVAITVAVRPAPPKSFSYGYIF